MDNNISLDLLNGKLSLLFDLKRQKDELEEKLSGINTNLEAVKKQVAIILESKGMDSYKGPDGSISWKKELYVNFI